MYGNSLISKRKHMKPYLLLILLSALGVSCDRNDGDCVDPDRIKNVACTTEYNPVCGCNNITYGNSCEADRAGVTRWTPGACR